MLELKFQPPLTFTFLESLNTLVLKDFVSLSQNLIQSAFSFLIQKGIKLQQMKNLNVYSNKIWIRNTVRKNNPFYQSKDGNCMYFGVWRYQSPKTWNLNDKVWTELAQRSTLTFLNYSANFWNLGTEYRESEFK